MNDIKRYLSLFPDTNKMLLKAAGVLFIVALIAETASIFTIGPLVGILFLFENDIIVLIAIVALVAGTFADRRLLIVFGVIIILVMNGRWWLTHPLTWHVLCYAALDLGAYAITLVLLLLPRTNSSRVLPALAVLLAVVKVIDYAVDAIAFIGVYTTPLEAALYIAGVIGLQAGIACVACAVATGVAKKSTRAMAATIPEK